MLVLILIIIACPVTILLAIKGIKYWKAVNEQQALQDLGKFRLPALMEKQHKLIVEGAVLTLILFLLFLIYTIYVSINGQSL